MRSRADEWRTEEGLTRLRGWARDGLTNEHIAQMVGVSAQTLYTWMNKYVDILEALKKGKDVADREIEEALFKKAKGYTLKIKKPIKVKKVTFDKAGRKLSEEEKVEYADEEVHVPPDTTAQIFWLKNRKPAEWRDKREEVQETNTEAAGVIEIPMVEDNT